MMDAFTFSHLVQGDDVFKLKITEELAEMFQKIVNVDDMETTVARAEEITRENLEIYQVVSNDEFGTKLSNGELIPDMAAGSEFYVGNVAEDESSADGYFSSIDAAVEFSLSLVDYINFSSEFLAED